MVERAAVNRDVVGSSPTSGAILKVVDVQRQRPSVGPHNARFQAICQKKCQKNCTVTVILQASDKTLKKGHGTP